MFELTMVLKNVSLRPARSLLTVLGLAVAVGAVVALVGIATRFEDSFLDLYRRRGGDLVIQRAGGAVQLSSGIDESLGQRIRRLPGVNKVIGCLMDMISFEQADLFAVLVNGWSLDCPVLDEVTIVSGRRFRKGDRKVVMLGKTLAANLGKHVGDEVELYSEPFKVIGIFDSFSIFESGAVFVQLDELQQLMNRPHHVTGYIVGVDKTAGTDRVVELQRQIASMDPLLVVLPSAEFVRNIAQIRVIRTMAWITSLIALVIGTVGISNTMIMSILERRAEIGTLRAIGWRTLRVVRLVCSESLVLCLCGAALGSLLGVLATRVLAHLPMTSGLVDGQIGAAVIAEGFGLAILTGCLGAMYPAVWVSRWTPLEAMRR
ncbi:MAG TPA: ABC transporter permease [Pirellulales bacterium]